MTPLIDVLLVLLVIFMIVASARRGLDVQVPPDRAGTAPPRPDALVLSVLPGPRYELNRQPLDGARLDAALKAAFEGRPRSVLFVDADPSLAYHEVVRALDASRGAGVQVVGLVPADG